LLKGNTELSVARLAPGAHILEQDERVESDVHRPVRIGQGSSMRADLHAAGIVLAPYDDDEPLRLAKLRVSTGLKLPDCCVLDVAIQLATFDATLEDEAHRRGVALTHVDQNHCSPGVGPVPGRVDSN
jgi:hypothetical protein